MIVGKTRKYSADRCMKKMGGGIFTVQLVEGESEHAFPAGCVRARVPAVWVMWGGGGSRE